MSSRFNMNTGAVKAERIFWKEIPVTFDEEENMLIHKTGFVKGNVTAGIGVITDIVYRFDFDKRYASPAVLIDDRDTEIG